MSRSNRIKVGDKFGYLTIIEKSKIKNSATIVKVRCKCGDTRYISYSGIKKGNPCRKCWMQSRLKYKIGDKNNLLTIIDFEFDIHKRKTLIKCRCDCGNHVSIPQYRFSRNKSCGCDKHQTGELSSNFTGYKDILGTQWYNIKKGAKLRKIGFLITIQEAWTLWIAQKGRCALTNIKLSLPTNTKKNGWVIFTASLDRIDSRLPYSKDNCQWVHKDINMMKQGYSMEYYINMCKLVSKNIKGSIKDTAKIDIGKRTGYGGYFV